MEKENRKVKISEENMIEVLNRSGYIIELQTSNTLKKLGFNSKMNEVYPDPHTEKSREIDIYANFTKPIINSKSDTINLDLIIECENNYQPVVFLKEEKETKDFNKKSDKFKDLKTIGFPQKIHSKDQKIWLNEFSNFYANHPNYNLPALTQYCSFSKPKHKNSDWIAEHTDRQHETFQKFIPSYKFFAIRKFEKITQEMSKKNKAQICLTFFQPLLVLNDNLYEGSIIEDKIVLKKKSHIKFQLNTPDGSEIQNFKIDVITKDYLKNYINELMKFMDKSQRIILKNREIFTFSASKDFDSFIIGRSFV
jgi:hypothetical protein